MSPTLSAPDTLVASENEKYPAGGGRTIPGPPPNLVCHRQPNIFPRHSGVYWQKIHGLFCAALQSNVSKLARIPLALMSRPFYL
jgi:hypothetical protein